MTKLEHALSTGESIAERIKFYKTEDNYALADRLKIDVEKASTLISDASRILVDVRDELQARVNDNTWLELEYKQEYPDYMTDKEGSIETSQMLYNIEMDIEDIIFDEEEYSPVLLAKKISDLILEINNMKKAADAA